MGIDLIKARTLAACIRACLGLAGLVFAGLIWLFFVRQWPDVFLVILGFGCLAVALLLGIAVRWLVRYQRELKRMARESQQQ